MLHIKNMVCPRCVMAARGILITHMDPIISKIICTMLMATACLRAAAQTDTIYKEHKLQGIEVKATNGIKSKNRVGNTEIIGQAQLFRAACCNLGESFTANPSVDVSYSDAATGARQIKLLGLSGTYVQMLTENIPNLRGAGIPYSLGYVPGPWMQSIQVSKGAASVKNGYESITGQIDIEYLKPQGTDGIRGNAYLDSNLKQEANLDGSIHLNDRLSGSLLLHGENRQRDHDGNGDGFMDMPRQKQYNVMNRWAYVSSGLISQLAIRLLGDQRSSGMSSHAANHDMRRYGVDVNTHRYEAQWKNALMLQGRPGTSIALMLHGSWHDAHYTFGDTRYNVTQKNGYAQLMYETDLDEHHNLAVGSSLNHDYYDELASGAAFAAPYPAAGSHSESTIGAYAQYTYKLGEQLTVMPGLRYDHSTLYGGFVTPRLHVKYMPVSLLTLRASVGKGYRSPHALAENTPLLASGRTCIVANDLKQETAWNMGLSAALNLPIGSKTLEVNAEYYYTRFGNQLVINFDGARGDHTLFFDNLHGRSYSHTLQVDATYPLVEGLTATAAWRYNDARTTYDGQLRQRPLTSLYKGLLTLSYKTPTALWQFDVTGQLNGKGKLYDNSDYPAYGQLQAQVTREFRHFSVYLGGENLTNYRIARPIVGAENPWQPSFDATQIWGPTEGAMVYIGIRIKFETL